MNEIYWILIGLFFGGIVLSVLIALWHGLARMQGDLDLVVSELEDNKRQRDSMAQHLGERLRQTELGYHRQLVEARSYIVERLVRSQQLQQKTDNDLQQRILVRFAKLYQALERRFGEMHQDLTEDTGRLRTELVERLELMHKEIAERLNAGERSQANALNELRESLRLSLEQHRQQVHGRHGEALRVQQETLSLGMETVGRQVGEALSRHAEDLGKSVAGLAETTDQRLRDISGQVEQRLEEGFKKSTETFTQVLTHLTRIDEAQKRITELSGNVINLQEVLADKGSRGAFGEVQLHALVRNLMPENSFALQHVLSNDMRVDCMLFLPEPGGNIGVDAKFPLESFRRMTDPAAADSLRDKGAAQFRQDIRKHIRDIATKYIVPGETADGAVMFIPAEAVFAEIHAHFPDLVEESYRRRVWMVSPTTMMAILTTARAVLKDAATREQVDIIQEHLQDLAHDFGRFQQRMDNLARHIHQAGRDVDDVNVSAKKISGRFARIEQVELHEPAQKLPLYKEAASVSAVKK